jgi:flagellar biosynthesis anti-sigma factor FlgM
MEIHGDRPLDPAARRRQLDAARGSNGPAAAGSAKAEATFSGADSAAVSRLVGLLKQANPADVQRIDELKARIADGSYRADPEELADLLLGRNR